MSAATIQSNPSVPPRPTRSQEKDNGSSVPAIPPRPVRRLNRSLSPNPARFAPSPLNESPFGPKSPGAARHSQTHLGEELERPTSVDMPNVGEEGREYAVAIGGLGTSPDDDESRRSSTSPEQTRTVGEDIKLYAPKPTMPAQSAKQRVAQVTRTDSERAAAFGIGRSSFEDQAYPGRSLKKKGSTTSQLSHQSEPYAEDEHGIPEIGQRVPMLLNAGDVQAPSPAPAPRAVSVDGTKPARNHTRKTSSRGGFGDLPSDVYGLHGHGVANTDKLEKAYYEKHPDALQKERYNHLHDRANDYSMSSENLNKIVRDTASRGAGTSAEHVGTPSEQVGYRAADEYTSRISRPPSTAPNHDANLTSPLKSSFTAAEATTGQAGTANNDEVIHVDEPRRKGYAKFGDEQSAEGEGVDDESEYPILASDEVAKDPSPYQQQPAVEPPSERQGESKSRPTSRPASIYSPPPTELHSTPLDDVEEYEPLFPEDEKSGKKPMTQAEKLKERRQRFPSQDIWEDAPNSVHSTAEVSTPELLEARQKEQAILDVPTREGETPAQAFARKQEELAEKEAVTPDSFLYRQQKPPSWVGNQSHLAKENNVRPSSTQRFPSRDVWEDTPDSLQFTATVSTPETPDEPQADEEPKPAAEHAPPKPAVPSRPKKQGSGDDSKPSIPDRPKPQIPIRPSKPVVESKGPEPVVKTKPAVPARPAGGKIAALQAGFMSDLNKRLRLGPQAPKKEDPPAENPVEEKEKTPLSDARKGRARGPQRRAPTKAAGPSGTESGHPPVANGKPTLSFSMTRTLWSIDEEGTMTVDGLGPAASSEVETKPGETASEEPIEADKAQLPVSPEDNSESKPESKLEGTPPVKPEDDLADSKPTETESEPQPIEETKTLATNTAGESILEETIEKKPSGDQVQKVEEVKDEVAE
ncbi:altered inheritance of mitochondria protein 21 [Annulohypoxylon maeteangense]|uniref:altered inheritance of mitochondria protein 21 n=1 Tax=Annulohypoxylon maeteangense TaxID=1927788 RepID=UPI0020084B55|nr:altered inheritance of mitochondria protein 21 [Annulohypoxylon maeteangense]KAI0888197.1 altered inheritance of mitochondria protein 21 [Annulohypoxylon maeteangense]